MKQVIIGIHGLGNKPPKILLEKWWKTAILEGFDINGVSKPLPTFELVYWADVLHDEPLDPEEKNKENPLYLDESYQKTFPDYKPEENLKRKKIVDFISEQLTNIFLNEDKTLNYSAISDFILKKYFTDLSIYYSEACEDDNPLTCKARETIRQRLANTIRKYRGYKILVVAHSMGSIVAFDVLTYEIPNIEIDTLITIGSPLGLPVVISKIADEQREKNRREVKVATPPVIKTNWFNMADILDHVAINYKLADDFIPNERGVAAIDFQVENTYQMDGEKNPHKSFGYLRTPEFSTVINEFIGQKPPTFGQKIVDLARKLIGIIKGKLLRTKNDTPKTNE